MAKLIEQWLPPVDKLGNLNLIDEQGNPSNTWVIPLQKRQVASIGIQGPEGLMFSINGAPTNKTNYLTIGAYGVYNLTRHDIQDLTIRSITIYFTETNSKWLTKNPWPIIVDVVYSEEEYKFIEATTPDTNNSDPINDSNK